MQQQPLPGAQIPYKFIGTWVPPAAYGILISPPIVVTAAAWPDGGPTSPAFPQFATTTGQQIGTEFYFYGTYLSAPSPGYLGNNWDQSNRYGAPVGSMMTFVPNVEALNDWQQSGYSVTVGTPPGPAHTLTPVQIAQQAIALLQQIPGA
jgi:hypothetical protein